MLPLVLFVPAGLCLGREDLGGQAGTDLGRPVEERPGQPRVGGHVGQGPAPLGGAAVVVDRAEVAQGQPGRVQRGGRRWVGEQEPGGVRRAPHGEVEGEPGQVGDRDLGRRVRGEMGVVGLSPAAVGRARTEPSRAAGPLVGSRPADADGDQAAEAARRVVPPDLIAPAARSPIFKNDIRPEEQPPPESGSSSPRIAEKFDPVPEPNLKSRASRVQRSMMPPSFTKSSLTDWMKQACGCGCS